MKSIHTGFFLLIIVLFCGTHPTAVHAQQSYKDLTIKVFLDAPWFELTYIRRQIPYVNYVNDPMDADLHIMVTRKSTGSGGMQYTISFIGQYTFASRKDELSFFTYPDETSDEIRKKFVQNLSLGLIPFLINTPYKDRLSITYEPGSDTLPAGPTDPWNGWVFYTAVNGWMSFQETYQNLNIWSNFNVSQIKDRWKHQFWFSNNYNESNYILADDRSYRNITRSWGAHNRSVLAISDHWSLGEMAGASASTYSNIKLNLYLQPAIEYNIYPYSQSNERRLGFNYSIGPRLNVYVDTTIYNKTRELFLRQSLYLRYYLIRSWGNIGASAGYSSLVPDFAKYNLSGNFNLSIRIIKGLSYNLSGGASITRDQISLPKKGATEEEILLQKKAMRSRYNGNLSFGLSYRFGSIYNNIVNPRFEL
ncbi:MAG TPA: hypothetical protein P5228_09295 [Bacteroidales bacterium]|nr:hypothetical protein [Bacteroidales bacterium]HRZ49008.1 hypothetical protein [Bacteroidales bacterium]